MMVFMLCLYLYGGCCAFGHFFAQRDFWKRRF
jgi:hypothetical protein